MTRYWRPLVLGMAALVWGSVLSGAPARRTQNVVLITTDGLRWQELFGGADEQLLNKEAGVSDPPALKREFWRDTPEARREALLPFLWTVIAKQGQVFGDATKNAPAKIANTMKFSYPGYSEMFVGYPDDERITSNNKFPNIRDQACRCPQCT